MVDGSRGREPKPLKTRVKDPRQLLVEDVEPKMLALAKSIAAGQGAGDVDDLMQIGRVIAHQYAERYDSGRARFWTFVYMRVRGAMLEACGLEREQLGIAEALSRGVSPVLDIVRVPDLEDVLRDPEGTERRNEEAIAATTAAAVYFLSRAPRTPEEMLASEQERARIHDLFEPALSGLPANDREFIEQTVYEDVPVETAGRELGLDRHPARNKFVAIKARLQRELKAKHAALKSGKG